MLKEEQEGQHGQYRVPRKRFVGDDTRSGGLAFSIDLWEIRCSGHCPPLPNFIHASECEATHYLVTSPLKAHSHIVDRARTHIPQFQGAGYLATLRVSVALFLYSQLSDTCLWRRGFLSWKVGWGKNPDVLVFLTGFNISPQDI